MDDRFIKKAFIVLLVITALLHFGVFGFIVAVNNGASPRQDAREYRHLAENILSHGVFSQSDTAPYTPELLRTPAYPLFLAGILLVDHTGYVAVAIQQLLVILGGILLFLIFVRHGMPKIGLVFTALWYVEPIQWFNSLSTMSDSFYTFLCLLLLYILIGRKKTAYATRAVITKMFFAGSVLGLMMLTRPVALLWVPAVLLFAVLAYIHSRSMRILGPALLLCTLLVILSPWLIRNYTLVHAPVISSSSVYNFVINYGNTEDSAFARREVGVIPDEKGRPAINIYGYSADAYPELQKRQQAILTRVGVVAIAQNNLMCVAPMWLVSRYDLLSQFVGITITNPVLIQLISIVTGGFWLVVVILAFVGIYTLLCKRMYALATLLAGTVIASSLITYCNALARIRIPLVPAAFLLAGFGVLALTAHLKRYVLNILNLHENNFEDHRHEYFETISSPNNSSFLILLDIDGTLVPDEPTDENALPSAVREKVAQLSKNHTVYLCTNGKDRERAKRIATELAVPIIESAYKKHSKKILSDIPLDPHRQTLVIGDKLLTDGLLAKRLRARFYLVKRKHPYSEKQNAEKRGGERLSVRLANWLDDVVATALISK